MKNILGHKSWNKKEVLEILRRSQTFTMCCLPHYRYEPVKRICRSLARGGWIEKAGNARVAINWKVTEKWKAYHDGSDLA